MPITGQLHPTTVFNGAAAAGTVSDSWAATHVNYGLIFATVTNASGLSLQLDLEGSNDGGTTWQLLFPFPAAITMNQSFFYTYGNMLVTGVIICRVAQLLRFKMRTLTGTCNVVMQFWHQNDMSYGG